MAEADAYGKKESASQTEWNAAKLKEYFTACQRKYNTFLDISDALIRAFRTYIDDSEHTGEEAESSKAFMEEIQIPLVEDIIYAVQLMEDMQNEMMAAFASDVDSAESAILKAERLGKIIGDFALYNKSFGSISSKINDIVDGLNSTCSEAGTFTEPDAATAQSAFDELVSEDGLSGVAPETQKKLEDFDAVHCGDIQGSELEQMCTLIEHNLSQLLDQTDGCLIIDITKFNDTKGKLDLMDASEVLTGTQLEDYETFIENMNQYLQGKKERCEVYKYDPVNMCTGNYINEHDDIRVGGAYPLIFHRFYNALSEKEGILGKGWSHTYGLHVSWIGEKEIKISYPDGSSGIYREVREGYWEEEHGEEGHLEVMADGYILRKDSGEYHAFNASGYLRETGDGNGMRYRVLYDMRPGCEAKDAEEERKVGQEVAELQQEWRIAKVETQVGSSLSFQYDTAGRLVTLTDHTGRKVQYTYDGSGRLVTITEADGSVRSFGYTQEGQISCAIDPEGNTVVRNTYDEKGRITVQKLADGGQLTFAYDDRARTTTTIEQNGNQVIYGHDALGRHIFTKYYDGEERFRYNKKNQKISITDKNGNCTRYSYDRAGHLTGIVDAEGKRTSITYHASGKPCVIKEPSGASWHYSYDLYGNLFETEDPLGNKTRFYYTDGKLTKIRDAEKIDTYLETDQAGNITAVIDASGVRSEYSYDLLGRIIKSRDMARNETHYSYDEADRITCVTDALGGETRYFYNMTGKLIKVILTDGKEKKLCYGRTGKLSAYTDEDGSETRITYNKMGKEEEVFLPNGGRVLYEYDPLMRITAITDPEGRRTIYRYDTVGNLLRIERGDTSVSYTYDVLGRAVSRTDGEGATAYVAYDAAGNQIRYTDAKGNVTRQEFDALGRLTGRTDALGNIYRYTYTAMGALKSITDPTGRRMEYQYGKNQKVLSVEVCGTVQETYAYDSNGRLSKRIMADGAELTYQYDALGRIIDVNGSAGQKLRYTYDARGRIILLEDNGRKTAYTYTGTGRTASVTDALGNVTKYTYDSLGDLHERIRMDNSVQTAEGEDNLLASGVDEYGHVTIYDHNLAGNLTAVTDAFGQKETYEYDAAGRLLSKMDRDGYKTGYSYDRNSFITGLEYADGRRASFSYDASGNLQKVKDWLGITELTNDALGRLIGITDPSGRSVTYEYNAVNERTSITCADGHTVQYDYDDRARLKTLTAYGQETAYRYDSFGRLCEKQLPNDIRIAYDYYQGGLLKSITDHDKEGLLAQYRYQYDESGNVSETVCKRRGLEAVSGKYQYEYDALGRLIGTSRNGREQVQYQYDPFGNRIHMWEDGKETNCRYDALDHLLEIHESSQQESDIVRSYHYDKRGNLTGIWKNGAEEKAYVFDVANRMSSVTDTEKGSISYLYNGLGFRTESESAGEKTTYLCDLTRPYYNLLTRITGGVTENFAYDNNVTSMHKEGKDYYYLQDELGSPMYLTGIDGMAVNVYAYDDFGGDIDPYTGRKEWEKSAGKVDPKGYTKQGNVLQPFAFTGYQRDEISGLSYAQARYYDQRNGRFISEDPIKGSVLWPILFNPYQYCINNPKKYIDPTGKILLPQAILAGAIVGAGVGIATQIITDIATGEVSSAQTYIGDAVGGAAGGAIYVVTGSSVGAGFVNGAITSSVTDMLNNITGVSNKSGKEIAVDAVINGGVGAATGKLGDLIGDGFKVLSRNVENDTAKIALEFLSGEFEGINKGRNSFEAVTKQMETKFFNGTLPAVTRQPSFLGLSAKVWKKMFLYQLYKQLTVDGIVSGTETNIEVGRLTELLSPFLTDESEYNTAECACA